MTEFYLEPVRAKPSGFSFENCGRNIALEKVGHRFPKVTKTGTTIVAAIFKDGVVMAADSRATEDDVIADKNCMKVHHITDTIYACGAGTAADLDQVGRMISAQLKLWELNTGRKARVTSAIRIAKQHLFKYQGYVGAYLLIGGMDLYGPKLGEVHAAGSTQCLPYCADGSGSLAATGVLETEFKPDMTESECVGLVRRAVEAGMHGDLASGNQLNYVVIRRDGVEFNKWNVPDFCQTQPRELKYEFKPDTTTVLKSKERKYQVIESMEVDS